MGAASIRLADLFRTPDDGQVNPLLRVGHFVAVPGSLQDLEEEEAQCADHLIDRVVGELSVTEQMGGVLADLFRAELVGRTVEIARKILDEFAGRRAWYLQCNCDARFHRASFFEDGSQGPPCDPNLPPSQLRMLAVDAREASAAQAA